MNQTICFSDCSPTGADLQCYKFDIELLNTSINIKVFNTTSLDLYEGSVNEAEIYIQPISKFHKMLVSGLNKENNFNFEINNLTDKLKCRLNYLNEFVDIEEFIILNKKANNKAVEYHLHNEINLLKEQVKLLSEQVNQMNSSVNFLLKENELLKNTIDERETVEIRGHQIPVNNVWLKVNGNGDNYREGWGMDYRCTVEIKPSKILNWFPGVSNLSHTFSSFFPLLNIKKLEIIATNDNNSHNQQLEFFINNYLSTIKHKILDEIHIRASSGYSSRYFQALQNYNNYKKIIISVQDANYSKLEFDLHCKNNNIQIEYVA